MKRGTFITFLLLSLILATVLFSLFYNQNKKQNRASLRIPVSFFPFTDQPTLKIEIEGKKYSVLIDLGSSHPFDLQSEYIQKILCKEHVTFSNYIDINGNSHIVSGFKIPKVKIGDFLTVHDGIVFEENRDFVKNTKIWTFPGIWNRLKSNFSSVQGRIGWTFFKELNCLFDFPQSTIYFTKDMPSLLKEAKYTLDDFTQVPFILEKFGIVLSIETDLGIKKFLLDSGTSHSILRKSLAEKEEVEQIQPDKWRYTTRKFRIGEEDFGSCSFWLFEFSDLFQCDGILGVDFFKKHPICLDFQNKTAYINLKGVSNNNKF